MKNIFLLILIGASLVSVACTDNQPTQETRSNANVKSETPDTKPEVTPEDDGELNVSLDYWKKQRDKALEPRQAPVGAKLKEVRVPAELEGNDGKQKTTLEEMKRQGFSVPMDFFDLAEKNLKKELVELPLATETYILDLGASATYEKFTAFEFKDGAKFSFEDGVTVPDADSEKQKKLQELADKFKRDLNERSDRRWIRMRLLRMLDPKARAVLEEIARKYQAKFDRPLRIISLTRSVDYSIKLNKTNPNSFLVRGKDGPIPPHCSGLTFDLALKHMTAEEQNFIIDILVEMEKNEKVDAVRETGLNPLFHIFVL
jgi:hypothetical protein